MARRAKMYEQTDIEKLAANLTKLPEKPRPLTIEQAIEALRPAILSLRDKGYSRAEIKDILAERDIKASLRTISKIMEKNDDRDDGKDARLSSS